MRTKYCKIIGAAILGVSLSACSSTSAIPENTFQSLAIASLPPTKAQTNIVIGKPLPFQPEQNDSSNLLLDSHSLPVSDSVITLWGLNLNSAGNRIEVAPGAQIQAVSAYIYNCISCNNDNSINQIIIGIKGIGAQSCIYEGGTQGQGISDFTLTAPQQPGTYSIQFRYAQAYSCDEAIQKWWNVDQPPADSSTIGVIVVD